MLPTATRKGDACSCEVWLLDSYSVMQSPFSSSALVVGDLRPPQQHVDNDAAAAFYVSRERGIDESGDAM